MFKLNKFTALFLLPSCVELKRLAESDDTTNILS